MQFLRHSVATQGKLARGPVRLEFVRSSSGVRLEFARVSGAVGQVLAQPFLVLFRVFFGSLFFGAGPADEIKRFLKSWRGVL